MKVEKIRQIVKLKQVMRRWRALSLRRLVGDPPPGFLAVYVGPDRQRFVIPTRFLNLTVFAAFLRRAEEEYGFPGPASGGLALPCDPAFFRCVIDALHRDEARFGDFSLDAFLVLFADHGPAAAVASSPCRDSSSYNRPLLPKTKLDDTNPLFIFPYSFAIPPSHGSYGSQLDQGAAKGFSPLFEL